MGLFLVAGLPPLADSLEGVEPVSGGGSASVVVDGVDLIEDKGEASGKIGSCVGRWGGGVGAVLDL